MTTSFAVALALTFAASVHCIGMCGGFAIAMSASGSAAWKILGHQCLMQLGKASSYAFLGALAGAFGAALQGNKALGWAPMALGILAGIAMAAAGLTMLGLTWKRRNRAAALVAPFWSRFVAPLLEKRPPGFPLVVGMAMGFLPCGLVYAGLAGAAASGSAPAGATIMAGVALGTVPALTATALVGTAIAPWFRTGLARIAGLVLIAVGVMMLYRNVTGAQMRHDAHTGASTVPACHGTK
ncbi:MAG: sulfite exporter TauE/SafE family protein [Acidobacteria bacterium]|nr:sulfite exporter TauE/SafE family protein [Acidobacteriota bacterium]